MHQAVDIYLHFLPKSLDCIIRARFSTVKDTGIVDNYLDIGRDFSSFKDR